jgi:hypothetical protein
LDDNSIILCAPHLDPVLHNLSVANLLMNDSKSWNVDLIHDMFDINTANKILKTPLFDSVIEDKIKWTFKKMVCILLKAPTGIVLRMQV